jgi:hypothetical protein
MSMRGGEHILSHLGDRLRVTVDGDHREKLLKRLISELDNLGRDAESRATLERHIAIGEVKIQKQRALLAGLKQNGHNTADAYFLLTTLLATQALLLHRRSTIARQIWICVVRT